MLGRRLKKKLDASSSAMKRFNNEEKLRKQGGKGHCILCGNTEIGGKAAEELPRKPQNGGSNPPTGGGARNRIVIELRGAAGYSYIRGVNRGRVGLPQSREARIYHGRKARSIKNEKSQFVRRIRRFVAVWARGYFEFTLKRKERSITPRRDLRNALRPGQQEEEKTLRKKNS